MRADGRHFGKIKILRYLQNGLTKIWQDDVYLTPGPHRPSECRLCEKPRWRRPLPEVAYISVMAGHRITGLFHVNQSDNCYFKKTTSGFDK